MLLVKFRTTKASFIKQRSNFFIGCCRPHLYTPPLPQLSTDTIICKKKKKNVNKVTSLPKKTKIKITRKDRADNCPIFSAAKSFNFSYRMLVRSFLRGVNRPFKESILSKFINLCSQRDNNVAARYSTSARKSWPDKPAGTMTDVEEKIITRLALEQGYTPIPKSREDLIQYQPKFEDLPPRSMQDSYTSAIIPLSNKVLQDKYVTFAGNVRLGRLLEDMDLFAVWVVHQHVFVPTLPEGIALPYTFVTVLVDKVDFNPDEKKVDKDIRISGHVSWVGRSTLEVMVWLEQMGKGGAEEITRATFLMAARNAVNTASLHVNPLQPATDEEREILSGGEERKKRRQIIQETSIFKVEPNSFEESLMYNLYKRTTDTHSMELNKRILPPNCRWMSESFAVNTVTAFPEHRNHHYSVFGGFLMRSALEISWVAACLYCKGRPSITHLCDITFEKPVSVKSFLKMIAYIVYTEANYMTVMTVIDALDSSTGMQVTTNVFYTVLEAKDFVPEVLPRSYQETMWYIQGRRKFRYSLGLE